MKRFLIHAGVTLVALGVLAFLVAAAGVIPLRASAGHWAITEWVLQFGKQRSVSTWSLGTHVPALDDRRLVLRGATHFEGGCRPCHGAPGADSWEPSESMTPDPPALDRRISEWDAAELFFIAKHGLKFTGMPAFPDVDRDDEVWSTVAFMLRLPDMAGDEYRALANGALADTAASQGADSTDAALPAEALVLCVRCHGADGAGREGAFPTLAGQTPEYIAASLRAYASGARSSGIMQSVAQELDEARIRELAAHYGTFAGAPALGRVPQPVARSLPAAATLLHGDALEDALESTDDAIARGETIVRQGLPDRKVPACVHCHGPDGGPRNPLFPRLAGQYADYLVLQLQLFHEERRGGTPYHGIMNVVARNLTPAEMVDVALYYASLGR